MKCPKCGFNSFEYYDICKKCSSDLTGYKQTYSITSMVLPLEAKEKFAAEVSSAAAPTDHDNDVAEIHDDIFSFDLPDDNNSMSAQKSNSPFDFDTPSSNVKQTGSLKPEDDVFADLLEPTSQVPGSSSVTAPSSSATSSSTGTAGANEFDLENFSWDDTSAETATTGSVESSSDFDSLFGETKENSSK